MRRVSTAPTVYPKRGRKRRFAGRTKLGNVNAPRRKSILPSGTWKFDRLNRKPAIAKLDANFTRADGFNSLVTRLSSLSNQLWVGGDFTEYRGQRAHFFVPVDQTTGAALDP
jgi:hypothetical protein